MKDFLRGFGSIIILFPFSERRSYCSEKKVEINIPTHSDYEALLSDWKAIGNDMWKAMEVENKNPSYIACASSKENEKSKSL